MGMKTSELFLLTLKFCILFKDYLIISVLELCHNTERRQKNVSEHT